MKKFIAVTIDVEPDCTYNWQYSNPLTFYGVSKGIGTRLQPLFEKHNIIPTYLINNVVLENNDSVRFFKHLSGNFELGTHLHPEFIEPEKKYTDYAGKSGRANCCFYDPEVEKGKIKNITNLFIDSFGYQPLSFRAGRYSAGSNTIESLRLHGYKVDTSITPHICWDDETREGPIDFTNAKEQPYFIKSNSILEEDINGDILQVPITIGLLKRNYLKETLSSVAGLRHKHRKFKNIWLRPYYSSFEEMKFLVDSFTERYKDRKAIVFNMMFHNVEVLPGLSPYSKSENDCLKYLNQLNDFFNFCSQNKILGIGLSDIYEELRK